MSEWPFNFPPQGTTWDDHDTSLPIIDIISIEQDSFIDFPFAKNVYETGTTIVTMGMTGQQITVYTKMNDSVQMVIYQNILIS